MSGAPLPSAGFVYSSASTGGELLTKPAFDAKGPAFTLSDGDRRAIIAAAQVVEADKTAKALELEAKKIAGERETVELEEASRKRLWSERKWEGAQSDDAPKTGTAQSDAARGRFLRRKKQISCSAYLRTLNCKPQGASGRMKRDFARLEEVFSSASKEGEEKAWMRTSRKSELLILNSLEMDPDNNIVRGLWSDPPKKKWVFGIVKHGVVSPENATKRSVITLFPEERMMMWSSLVKPGNKIVTDYRELFEICKASRGTNFHVYRENWESCFATGEYAGEDLGLGEGFFPDMDV